MHPLSDECPVDPFDLTGRRLRRLVLPDPDNGPPEKGKSLICVPVAESVSLELLQPPLGVGLGYRPMLGAAMPEAAVHQDDKACARECNVDATSWQSWNAVLDSIAQTKSVQLTAQTDLGHSIRPSKCRELCADRWRRWNSS